MIRLDCFPDRKTFDELKDEILDKRVVLKRKTLQHGCVLQVHVLSTTGWLCGCV